MKAWQLAKPHPLLQQGTSWFRNALKTNIFLLFLVILSLAMLNASLEGAINPELCLTVKLESMSYIFWNFSAIVIFERKFRHGILLLIHLLLWGHGYFCYYTIFVFLFNFILKSFDDWILYDSFGTVSFQSQTADDSLKYNEERENINTLPIERSQDKRILKRVA